MSRRPGASWVLGGVCTAVGVAFLGWIGFGQLGPVKVPSSSEWALVASMCPDPAVDAGAYAEMSLTLEEWGVGVRPEEGSCDGRSAIHIRVSAADVERLYPTTEAMSEFAVVEVRSAREAFERTVVGGTITDCTVWLRFRNDTKAMVHGVLHCTGLDHPVPAPSGHIMHPLYDRQTLRDHRGIGAKR